MHDAGHKAELPEYKRSSEEGKNLYEMPE